MFLDRNMPRKGGKIVSIVCFTLIALTFIKCCTATADAELDADQKVNLVADEVKASARKGKGAKADIPGKYSNSFVAFWS